jgi:glycosyltransferase involved in cell wall biosynthesis
MASGLKFALVSHVLPPSPSGQAVVLSRLLRDLDPQQYCLISIKDYSVHDRRNRPQPLESVTQRLPGSYHCLPPETELRVLPLARLMRDNVSFAIKQLFRFPYTHRREDEGEQRRVLSPVASPPIPLPRGRNRPGLSWRKRCQALIGWIEDSLNIRRQVAQRATRIYDIVVKEGCTAVVACSGDLIDVPAAWRAARRAGVPFYVYMFDDYATHMVPPFHRQFAQEMMPRLARDAAGIVVPNEFLARTYRERYAIDPWIISNPIENVAGAMPRLAPMGRPARIVYTGAVYEAHFDAIQRMIEALRSRHEPDAELHIYTSICKNRLAQFRIGSPAIVHDSVSAIEATRLQQEADIVFLPLAFDSPIPEIINTSAPGKMGELLASGRPVLVHAPRESFVSWYFRQHECGAVVDERNPALLQQAIERLTRDADYCQRLVLRARERALSDFSLQRSQRRFVELLSGAKVAA